MKRRGNSSLAPATAYDRVAHDFYPTTLRFARALVEIEAFPDGVWECACGEGDLSKVLIEYGGVDVVSTDLVDRGFGRGGVDFLKTKTLRRPDIATNPPFQAWLEFARHAVELGARKIALLGRLQLLENFAGRPDFFRRTRGWRVHYVGRSNMLPRGAADRGGSGVIPTCWFVRDRRRRNVLPEFDWHQPRERRRP